ncbi:hypothetical protein SLS62_003959 [Diatrype stigma]|uniref:Uncharacterized protein n=1 Tax=Diatrype stigma TaxID=117547 RepID=A0AAN9YPL6_9PEZI
MKAAASTGSLYVWQATDFSFGCGSAACGIGFNVTAPAGYIAPSSSTSTSNPTTSPAPAFDVQCGVQYGVSAPWTDCTPNGAPEGGYETSSDSKVQVRWDAGNGTAPPYRVRVSHTWYDGAAGARWNATGEGSSAGAADFEVRGTRLVGEVT